MNRGVSRSSATRRPPKGSSRGTSDRSARRAAISPSAACVPPASPESPHASGAGRARSPPLPRAMPNPFATQAPLQRDRRAAEAAQPVRLLRAPRVRRERDDRRAAGHGRGRPRVRSRRARAPPPVRRRPRRPPPRTPRPRRRRRSRRPRRTRRRTRRDRAARGGLPRRGPARGAPPQHHHPPPGVRSARPRPSIIGDARVPGLRRASRRRGGAVGRPSSSRRRPTAGRARARRSERRSRRRRRRAPGALRPAADEPGTLGGFHRRSALRFPLHLLIHPASPLRASHIASRPRPVLLPAGRGSVRRRSGLAPPPTQRSNPRTRRASPRGTPSSRGRFAREARGVGGAVRGAERRGREHTSARRKGWTG